VNSGNAPESKLKENKLNQGLRGALSQQGAFEEGKMGLISSG